MRAIIRVGVRHQGRVRGHEGPHISVARQTIDVPVDFTEKQLAVAVSMGEIGRAFAASDSPPRDEVDTVEFMVDFEEDE